MYMCIYVYVYIYIYTYIYRLSRALKITPSSREVAIRALDQKHVLKPPHLPWTSLLGCNLPGPTTLSMDDLQTTRTITTYLLSWHLLTPLNRKQRQQQQQQHHHLQMITTPTSRIEAASKPEQLREAQSGPWPTRDVVADLFFIASSVAARIA